MKIRFSKDAFPYITALIDLFAHEQIEFAMNNVSKKNRKILQKSHLLELGCSDLSLSCLYNQLPTYKKAQVEEEQRQKVEKAQEELKKAERKAKAVAVAAAVVASKATVPGTNQPAAPVTATVQPHQQQTVVVVKSTKDKSHVPIVFGHYIKQIYFNIINEKQKTLQDSGSKDQHPFTEIRISNEFKQLMSTEIVEFIQRLAPLLKGEINAWGLKTISAEVAEHTISFLLNIYGVNSTKVALDVNTKIATYNAAQKTLPVSENVQGEEDENDEEDDVAEVPLNNV